MVKVLVLEPSDGAKMQQDFGQQQPLGEGLGQEEVLLSPEVEQVGAEMQT